MLLLRIGVIERGQAHFFTPYVEGCQTEAQGGQVKRKLHCYLINYVSPTSLAM